MDKNVILNTGIVTDSIYLDKYVSLISNNESNKHLKGYQRHHIIPKYYFSTYDMPIDESLTNVVNLKYSDHILAHYYLWQCSSSAYFKYANAKALQFICKDTKFQDLEFLSEEDKAELDSKYLETLQYNKYTRCDLEISKRISEKLNLKYKDKPKAIKKKPARKKYVNPNLKNVKLSEYAQLRVGNKNSFYGKHHSEETKKRISQANGLPVVMLDYVTKTPIKEFDSASSAAAYLISEGITQNKSAGGRILIVCYAENLDSHAYGYSWKFKEKCND